jgi:divalent metal cation (Fe/Co/Zn/Cd) transporter
MDKSLENPRAGLVRSILWIEIISIIWMVIEMGLSIAAGIKAGSILLIAFGLDSLIELVSAGVLFWRFVVESQEGELSGVERREQQASRVVAIKLGLLCLYVLASSMIGLLSHSQPENSIIGISVSAAAVIIMPVLAFYKFRIAKRVHSGALREDAVNSITCAYMAGTVLLGLVLNSILGWGWIEYAAALLFLIWLTRETVEAFKEGSL